MLWASVFDGNRCCGMERQALPAALRSRFKAQKHGKGTIWRLPAILETSIGKSRLAFSGLS
jgi:hypothetical protein